MYVKKNKQRCSIYLPIYYLLVWFNSFEYVELNGYCYRFVCTISFAHQVILIKNVPTYWNKTCHISEIQIGDEIRKCCVVDQGKRNSLKVGLKNAKYWSVLLNMPLLASHEKSKSRGSRGSMFVRPKLKEINRRMSPVVESVA